MGAISRSEEQRSDNGSIFVPMLIRRGVVDFWPSELPSGSPFRSTSPSSESSSFCSQRAHKTFFRQKEHIRRA